MRPQLGRGFTECRQRQPFELLENVAGSIGFYYATRLQANNTALRDDDLCCSRILVV